MSNETNNPNEPRGSNEARRNEYLDELKKRFVILPTEILLDRQAGKLTPQDIYFYCYLLAKQGRNDSLWWGYDSLELITGLSTSVMKQAMERLVASGHIRRKRQRDGATITYCQTLVNQQKEILVRGVKVGDATKEQNDLSKPTPIQIRFTGATSDRNSRVYPSGAHADTNLN